jgi:hypothetical protein
MTPTAATIAAHEAEASSAKRNKSASDSPRPRAKPRRCASMRFDNSAMSTKLSRPSTTSMAINVASAAHAPGSAASRTNVHALLRPVTELPRATAGSAPVYGAEVGVSNARKIPSRTAGNRQNSVRSGIGRLLSSGVDSF